MKNKKIFITTAVIFSIVLLGIGIFFVYQRFYSGKSDESNEEEKKIAGMAFEVTVPKNTPEGDTVHIFFQNQKNYKMKKIEDYKYWLEITEEEAGAERNGIIKYRYSRNGYNFRTAEYLEPDTNDYFWTEKGRSVTYEEGKIQKDIVKRWRWFPEEGVEIIRTSNLEPSGNFLPRINNEEFLSGQIIEDLYEPAYDDFFDSTASHMKSIGYNSVEIDPPWQWIEENGLPKVKNEYDKNPNYPSDEKLKEEILAYKNKGLTVILAPQLCCNPINTENRPKEWWDAYFSETTKFLVHHAKIAEETEVDYFHYALGHEYWENDYAARWSNVFKEIRKHFSGKVGEMVWNFGTTLGKIIPDADFIKWGGELDYFYIAISVPISTKNKPTDDELKAGAAKMLDGAKQLYDRYKKPVFVRTSYFSIENTWKGNTLTLDFPGLPDPEGNIEHTKYKQGAEDQARVVNAYFRAIAERPWIIGYAQFGYGHWENPLVTDLSVRSKPAEDIWRKWNYLIFE